MNSYLLTDQLIQYGLNSVIAFLIFSILARASIRLFKIENYRLRSFFRLVPILRIALEPLFWILPLQNQMINASVFSCTHPFQRILYRSMSDQSHTEMSHYGLKTIIGKQLLMLPSMMTELFLMLFATITLYKVGSLFLNWILSFKLMKEVVENATENSRKIENQKLINQLRKRKATILISNEITVPLAGWNKKILIPTSLSITLSQDEFESVISHELEHLIWKDTIVRMFTQLVATIHWWVPFGSWLDRIEQEQELACDLSVNKYQLDGTSLASALKKTVQNHHSKDFQCAAFTPKLKSKLMERLHACLSKSQNEQNKYYAFFGGMTMMTLMLIFRFIIC